MSEKHWQMMKEVIFEIKRLMINAEKEIQIVANNAAESGE